MENLWIILVLAYGLLKGARECMKKESLKKSSLMEVLFLYMLVGFIFTLPDTKSALELPPVHIFHLFIKSVVVCIGFLLSFVAIRGLPIGLYSIMTLSQMVFTTILSILFLKEPFGIYNFIGLLLVISGLVMANFKKDGVNEKKIKIWALVSAVAYCFFNSISAVMDKFLMRDMTSAQLQFWFMFFSTILYGIILIVKREKISLKTLKTNFWIPLMGFLLVLGDRLLFIANGAQNSKVTVMTLLLQVSVVVTIILGRVIYKEKNFIYKLCCAGIVISGIVVSAIK